MTDIQEMLFAPEVVIVNKVTTRPLEGEDQDSDSISLKLVNMVVEVPKIIDIKTIKKEALESPERHYLNLRSPSPFPLQ
jgi:hypothetical protein